MKNVNQKANKKVQKALGVFDKAIKEVADAQALLTEGVKLDVANVIVLKQKIRNLEMDIESVEDGKRIKGENMQKNSKLLRNLKQFKA